MSPRSNPRYVYWTRYLPYLVRYLSFYKQSYGFQWNVKFSFCVQPVLGDRIGLLINWHTRYDG